jgi:rhamnosyltransferase
MLASAGSRPARLGAVVVAFNPSGTLPSGLAAIRGQVDRLIVADNSQDKAVREQVQASALQAGADYLGLEVNHGVAGALNAGFSRLHNQGFTHAIAFDQDSTPSAEMCTCLIREISLHSDMAVLGSDWFDEANPGHRPQHVSTVPWLPFLFRRRRLPSDTTSPVPVSFSIMSGSCFDLHLWKRLEGFDEALMLDLVDQEYCLRAIDEGLQVALLPGARLLHRRGDKRAVQRFGRIWHPSFMSPNRLRCMFHNRTRLILPWFFRHPHMALYEMSYSLKLLFDICFLEGKTWPKLQAITAGIIDALCRRKLKL